MMTPEEHDKAVFLLGPWVRIYPHIWPKFASTADLLLLLLLAHRMLHRGYASGCDFLPGRCHIARFKKTWRIHDWHVLYQFAHYIGWYKDDKWKLKTAVYVLVLVTTLKAIHAL